MPAGSPKPRSVTVTRVFDAPRELVFRTWTEAEHVVEWMKCDVAATLEVENWVATVGTEFTTYMVQPGVFEVRGTGRFTKVEPPRLLEYVLDADPRLEVPEMTVHVVFEERGDQTKVILTQSGIPSDFIFGVINAGWTASFSQLATVLGTGLSHARPETGSGPRSASIVEPVSPPETPIEPADASARTEGHP